MGIRSDTFGSVTLTGEDARQFVAQVKQPPNPAAATSMQRGRDLVRNMKNGEFTVSARPKQTARLKK